MTTLSSSSRYSLTESPNGYIFTTDYGNEYLVTFSDLTSIINLKGLKIYDFGIEVVNRNSVKNDKLNGKLKNTGQQLRDSLGVPAFLYCIHLTVSPLRNELNTRST